MSSLRLGGLEAGKLHSCAGAVRKKMVWLPCPPTHRRIFRTLCSLAKLSVSLAAGIEAQPQSLAGNG